VYITHIQCDVEVHQKQKQPQAVFCSPSIFCLLLMINSTFATYSSVVGKSKQIGSVIGGYECNQRCDHAGFSVKPANKPNGTSCFHFSLLLSFAPKKTATRFFG
jgi:hypothetical protein